MKNFIQKGFTLPYANSSGSTILSGAVIVIVGFGTVIATMDIADGTTGEVLLTGVVQLAKTTSLVINQYDRVYWDNSTKKVTKTASGNQLMGHAAEAALSADTVMNVKLVPLGAGQSTNIAAISTVDGSDAGTTQTLANATKAKVNAIIAALIAAGLMSAT